MATKLDRVMAFEKRGHHPQWPHNTTVARQKQNIIYIYIYIPTRLQNVTQHTKSENIENRRLVSQSKAAITKQERK